KVGIAFRHWSTVPGCDCYFHPFLTQLDHGAAFLRNSLLRRNGVDVDAHPDGFFLNARLAQERKAPVAPAHFPFELNYSYHFDAALLGRCLAAHAQRLGVARRECTITEVLRDGRGAIAGLRT